MNMTYIRVGFYFVAPLLGTIPGVEVDLEAMTILIHIESLAAGLAGSAIVTALVFKIWGKK